jgi:hypothetical protein
MSLPPSHGAPDLSLFCSCSSISILSGSSERKKQVGYPAYNMLNETISLSLAQPDHPTKGQARYLVVSCCRLVLRALPNLPIHGLDNSKSSVLLKMNLRYRWSVQVGRRKEQPGAQFTYRILNETHCPRPIPTTQPRPNQYARLVL